MAARAWLVSAVLSLTVGSSLAEYTWTGKKWEWRRADTESLDKRWDDSEQGSGDGGLVGRPDDEDDSASPWKPQTAPNGPVRNLRLFASQLSKNNKVMPLQGALRVTWSPPDKEMWNDRLLGYTVGYKETNDDEPYMFEQVEGNFTRRGDNTPLYFAEVEGAEHAHIISGLEPLTKYTVTVRVSNPWGRFESIIINEVYEFTEREACTVAPLPDAETFVEVSGNTFTLHLQNWTGGNCPTHEFAIHMYDNDSLEWELREARVKQPDWKLGDWARGGDSGAIYRIKVIRKITNYVDEEVRYKCLHDFKESKAKYEISTLRGSSPGCIIELGVKYSGHNLLSQPGLSQAACATLCSTEAECSHWTYNPTRVKCWLKTSSQGRAASTKGSNSGQKACGVAETETETTTIPQSSELNQTESICLHCIQACKIEENVKYSGSNLYSKQGITQAACAELCVREPKCYFWTHNAIRTVSKCWLKTDDQGREASTKGSVSGQKSCGVTDLNISSGLVLQDGCECEPGCTIEENVKFGGHNVYNNNGIKGGNGAPGCAALCYRDPKCHFWTYNGQARKCWLKKSAKGRAPSTKGSISGQKACGEESALHLFPVTNYTAPPDKGTTSILLTGGSTGYTSKVPDFLYPASSTCSPPAFPDSRTEHVTFTTPSGLVATCGGRDGPRSGSPSLSTCLVLQAGKWQSDPRVPDLPAGRWGATAASVPAGVIVMGGRENDDRRNLVASTSFVLRKNGSFWEEGPALPGDGAEYSCSVAVGELVFLLGGVREGETSQVRELDTSTWEWQEEAKWPQLGGRGRTMHGCGVLNSQLIVAGGQEYMGGVSDMTATLDLGTRGARWQEGGRLKLARYFHAMVTMGAVGHEKLYALGGYNLGMLDSVEVWGEESRTWREEQERLPEAKGYMGAVAVREASVCQQIEKAPPKIERPPQALSVKNGGIAVFFCYVTGQPAPNIIWKKNGEKIRYNDPRLTRYLILDFEGGSLLRIEPVVRRKEACQYECVAQNGNGPPVRATAELTVFEEKSLPDGFPQIIRHPAMKVVEKGRHAVLVCEASGTPKPTITWMKDTLPIDRRANPRLSLMEGSLRIEAAEESDEGQYECAATNTLGTAYSYSARLYVRVRRVPPHFTTRPKLNYEVKSGQDLNITCVSAGSPMPSVRWREGVQDLTPYDGAPIGKNVLRLHNIRQTRNYTCLAASKLGIVETHTLVKVQ